MVDVRNFICTGHEPIPGCGRILTEEEREYYGAACEECERAWADAVAAWRHKEPCEYEALFNEFWGGQETQH